MRQHPDVASRIVDPTAPVEVSSTIVPVAAPRVSGARIAAVTRCKNVDVWYRLKSVLGFTLYKWHHNVTFCYNGSKVTSWGTRYDYVTEKDPTWRVGPLKVNKKTAAGHASAISHLQREMKQCLPKVGCLDNRLPWSKITVTRSGSYSYVGANQ